ncbi:MAG: CoA-binding protein [Planctomycetota bacterium]|nr:CoA-binding protein [Planctomycetota bacterium]MEE2713895.1 CoA-binding protein [Planctomycetota bacterium]
MPLVAVVGASRDRSKFGNKALRAYARRGWDVRPVHPTESVIEGLVAVASLSEIADDVDRVTLYVPPAVGLTLLDAIAALAPKELWVNPGAESEALLQRAHDLGLAPILGCAIIDIGESPATL